jgi:UDP-2-acetamido-2-deoxy-ribo-hexuluronate aminotransferase
VTSPAAAEHPPGPLVPFFSQAATFAALRPRIDRELNEVLDDGKFSHGAKVAQLERAPV